MFYTVLTVTYLMSDQYIHLSVLKRKTSARSQKALGGFG